MVLESAGRNGLNLYDFQKNECDHARVGILAPPLFEVDTYSACSQRERIPLSLTRHFRFQQFSQTDQIW